jgi:hypothetical protein
VGTRSSTLHTLCALLLAASCAAGGALAATLQPGSAASVDPVRTRPAIESFGAGMAPALSLPPLDVSAA